MKPVIDIPLVAILGNFECHAHAYLDIEVIYKEGDVQGFSTRKVDLHAAYANWMRTRSRTTTVHCTSRARSVVDANFRRLS
jgi:hypothetical protein